MTTDPDLTTQTTPDDCFPPPDVIGAVLRGPATDPATGRYAGGPWAGLTPDEVLAERDAYRRACGE